jgi:peptidyl-prolyl cis-trans isomerase C
MKMLISFLVIITFVVGCSDFDKFYQEKRAKSMSPKGKREVVARVGEEVITKEDLIKSLESIPIKQRFIYLSSPKKLREYLESYINQIVLYKEAQRRGIDKREDIRESLERYKRKLLIRALAEEIQAQKFSEDDIKRYYDENSKDFEQVRISQIFIKIAPKEGITRDKAMAEAEIVVKRARSGEEFEKLVEEFSDDLISKKKGGDFGYVSRGRLPVEIEEKIFSLEEGEISDPIETQNGFYIIKVTEGVKIPPLDQVKGKIQADLRRRVFSEYTKDFREKMGVEIFEDNLKEISTNDEAN